MKNQSLIQSTSNDVHSSHLFPVFLKLENLRLLIVGAGNVGLEKLNAVLQNSPACKVTVLAIEISDAIKLLAVDYPNVQLLQKQFEAADLLEKDIVIVAINDKEVSGGIRHSAKAKNLLVNVADTPELCDFYLGSIVKKGNVKIAISTNGKSPTLAKRLKEILNETIPQQVNELAENLNAIRNGLNGEFRDKVKKLNELTKKLIPDGAKDPKK